MPTNWILPLQMLLPMAFAGILLLPIKALNERKIAWLYSAFTSMVSLGVAILIAIRFDWSNPGHVQIPGEFAWLPELGLRFSFGVDSISIALLILTALLMPVVVVASLLEVKHDMRKFQFWLHVLEAALMGSFMARDLVFFYTCFEITLIPLFFLIAQFGHHDRLRAAKVMFFYAFTGSMVMLAGIFYVAWWGYQSQGAPWSGQWHWDIESLWAIGNTMSRTQQTCILGAFVLGLGIKTPLFPFHTWLPLVHTEAPTAGSVDLAGLVLKLGPYGLLRFAIPMLPLGVLVLAPWLGALAVIGVIAAALIAWVQTDAKKLVAYSSISHMGFAVLALFAFDKGSIGATGAMVYMLSHGLATGGLFICLGMLYDRFQTRDLDRLSGLAKIMPLWAFFFGIFAFASVGLPGLSGFVGEFLCLIGSFGGRYDPAAVAGLPTFLGMAPELWLPKVYAVLAGSGVVLAAIYVLHLLGRVAFGPLKRPFFESTGEHGMDKTHGHDLSSRETAILVPLALACLLIGIYPKPLTAALEPAVRGLCATVNGKLDALNPAIPASTVSSSAASSTAPAEAP